VVFNKVWWFIKLSYDVKDVFADLIKKGQINQGLAYLTKGIK
jgi:hypothetical protein